MLLHSAYDSQPRFVRRCRWLALASMRSEKLGVLEVPGVRELQIRLPGLCSSVWWTDRPFVLLHKPLGLSVVFTYMVCREATYRKVFSDVTDDLEVCCNSWSFCK